MFGRKGKRSAIATACSLASIAACVRVDTIPTLFNKGALAGYTDDPEHDPADRRASLVAAIVKSELIDGYFTQGDPRPETIDAWLARAELDPSSLCKAVVDSA